MYFYAHYIFEDKIELTKRFILIFVESRVLDMFSFAKKLVDRLEGGTVSNETGTPDSYFKSGLQLNNKGYALRVLNVEPHSTAHQKGLESWFDYIVRINYHELPMMYPSISSYSYSINDDGSINYGDNTTQEQAGMINYDILHKEIANIAKNDKASKELVLDVWNAKGGIIRQVILPLDKYESSGEEKEDQTALSLFKDAFAQVGLTLQSQHLNTATYVWRILNTHHGSPAFQAQLIPYSDYIIGCDSAYPEDTDGKGLLAKGGESLLSRTVMSYYNLHYSSQQEDVVPITLYVYNHDYDILRPVTVNLSRSWGLGQNKGILGCDVGYGLLHRIPEVIGKFDSNDIIDDVLFESEQNVGYTTQGLPQNQDLQPVLQFISPPAPASNPVSPPGNVFVPQASAPPPRAGAPRKKKHTPAGPNLELNDYMNEELAKSKERDVLSSESEGTAPPPPPKAAK